MLRCDDKGCHGSYGSCPRRNTKHRAQILGWPHHLHRAASSAPDWKYRMSGRCQKIAHHGQDEHVVACMQPRPRNMQSQNAQPIKSINARESPSCKTEHIQNHTKRPCSELATTSTGCAHGFSALGLDMAKQQNHQGMK